MEHYFYDYAEWNKSIEHRMVSYLNINCYIIDTGNSSLNFIFRTWIHKRYFQNVLTVCYHIQNVPRNCRIIFGNLLSFFLFDVLYEEILTEYQFICLQLINNN